MRSKQFKQLKSPPPLFIALYIELVRVDQCPLITDFHSDAAVLDYSEPASLTAVFPVGSMDNDTVCIFLTIIDDDVLEGHEDLTVQLVSVADSSSGMNAVNLGTATTGTITIKDNDGIYCMIF